jgi:hypothetical protein
MLLGNGSRDIFGIHKALRESPSFRPSGPPADIPAMEDPNVVNELRERSMRFVSKTNTQIQRYISSKETLNPDQSGGFFESLWEKISHPMKIFEGIGPWTGAKPVPEETPGFLGSIWNTITAPSRYVFGGVSNWWDTTNNRIDNTIDTVKYVAIAGITVGGVILLAQLRNALR